MRPRADEGVAVVIGAILILAIMGISLLYVNSFYVPRQGATLEATAREEAEAALRQLGADLSGETGPIQRDLPLKPQRALPPLLSGIVLSPARVDGRLAFVGDVANITISVVTQATPSGVVNDSTRKNLTDGTMRVWLVGNDTAGRPMGSLQLGIGGGYLTASTYRLEGGAVLNDLAAGSSLVSPPSLLVGSGGTSSLATTKVTWRLPLLAGAEAEVAGGSKAGVTLAPGPISHSGGGQTVHNVTIVVNTTMVTAWKDALDAAIGTRGTVTTTQVGAADNGTVTATILPPAGTPATTRAVELYLSAVRYEVAFTGRT